MHHKGYLHCDIKPDNWLMGRDNKRNVVHLVDFGLAREYDETNVDVCHLISIFADSLRSFTQKWQGHRVMPLFVRT